MCGKDKSGILMWVCSTPSIATASGVDQSSAGMRKLLVLKSLIPMSKPIAQASRIKVSEQADSSKRQRKHGRPPRDKHAYQLRAGESKVCMPVQGWHQQQQRKHERRKPVVDCSHHLRKAALVELLKHLFFPLFCTCLLHALPVLMCSRWCTTGC